VRVIGRYSQKLAICEKWGVKHRHADDIGRRADQDIVVECTGSPDGFALAARLVRPRGTIVLKTLHADWDRRQIGADLTPLVMNEINVIGSAHGPLGEALGVLQRHEVDVVSLIGRRMSLGDGVAILKAAAQPGALKVLVDVA
jgi:threonine dehydrogenase-like Zn-dependent dehydrogenase